MSLQNTKLENSIAKRLENSWTLLVTENLFKNDNFSIVTLPHPGTGKLSKYCLDDIHSKIYEVIAFDEPHRSWFIGETVKSDGSLQILTVINPLFIVLPRLREQCNTRAVPLEDLLSEKGYDKIIDFIPNLEAVADLKGPPDMKAYKYNHEKTLKWLETKVRKLSTVLREQNIHVTSGAVSATFVASHIDNTSIDEEFYLKYACGLISEYLPEDLAENLESQFSFKQELIENLAKKRKSEPNCESNTKKTKLESSTQDSKENDLTMFSNTLSEAKKPKQLSAKEKARQKAASGTKSISSFFTKK